MGGWAGRHQISFPEHNSATVRNILMLLGRIIEQVNAECSMQEFIACLHFLIISPEPYFLLHFSSVSQKPFEIFDDTS